MIHKVISTIEHYNMFDKGTTVIIALSGGADSMALLSVLSTISSEYQLNIIAAHVNHCLRDDESDRDELYVKEYCARSGIELRTLKVNVKNIASSTGESIEECGRRIRYEFFNSINQRAKIATAHTLSDSIETIIFNLARGSALKGLCGIPAVRDKIIRPLIKCSRKEIEEYCRMNNISYMLDSTNSDDKYTRNHIRLNIIPQLNRINQSYDEAISRCSQILYEDEDLLSQLSDELLNSARIKKDFNAKILASSHVALRKRVISSILFEKTGLFAENKHIISVDSLLCNGGSLQIKKGTTVLVKNGILSFPINFQNIGHWSLDFKEGIIEIPENVIEIKIINRKDLDKLQYIHNNILDNCFDYDKIIGKAIVRSRCNGDSIRLSNRKCTKTIRKLFNEKAIPAIDRSKIAMIADNEGLLWINGVGIAERCEITKETSKIVLILL